MADQNPSASPRAAAGEPRKSGDARRGCGSARPVTCFGWAAAGAAGSAVRAAPLLAFRPGRRSSGPLTAAGAAYLARVRQGLQALQMLPEPSRGDAPARIRLATTPTFSRQASST